MANAFRGKGLTVKVLDVGRQDPGSFDHFGWILTRRVGGILGGILTRRMFSPSQTHQNGTKKPQLGGK